MDYQLFLTLLDDTIKGEVIDNDTVNHCTSFFLSQLAWESVKHLDEIGEKRGERERNL